MPKHKIAAFFVNMFMMMELQIGCVSTDFEKNSLVNTQNPINRRSPPEPAIEDARSRYLTIAAAQSEATAFSPTPVLEGRGIWVGILGRIAAINHGYAPMRKLKICIQDPKDRVDGSEFLLDTKLAFATWIEAAKLDPIWWTRFEFEVLPDCDIKSLVDTSQIYWRTQHEEPILEALPEFNPSRYAEREFNQRSVVRSQTSETTAVYSGPAIKAGLGSAGAAAMSFPPARIKYTVPAYTILSQYIDFLSLGNAIALSQLLPDVKALLLDRYKSMKTSRDIAFADLTGFIGLMKSYPIIIGEDPVFRREVQSRSFLGDNSPFTFRPNICYFNVLVHEIGHQFGLEHHSSGDASIMGPSSKSLFPTSNDEAALQQIHEVVSRPLDLFAH